MPFGWLLTYLRKNYGRDILTQPRNKLNELFGNLKYYLKVGVDRKIVQLANKGFVLPISDLNQRVHRTIIDCLNLCPNSL